MKILVIDDEKDILELYTEMLEAVGHEVTSCLSGDEGIAEVKKDDFELIISDKKMGKVSGLDVLKEVEKSQPQAPFLLITGDSSEKVAFQNSMSKVIRKPFRFKDLFNYIDTLHEAS